MEISKTGRILVVLLLCFCEVVAQKTREGNLAEMIDSENRFAKMAYETSIKASFLAYLDSSGIIFNGGVPGNGIALYSQLKEGKDLLTWYPVVAQVSFDGDMGFTSGPYQFAAGRGQEPLFSGYFFSLWKRNAAGVFKVILDAGLQHSNSRTDVFVKNPKPRKTAEYGNPPGVKNEKEVLPWDSEVRFKKLAEQNPAAAYRQFLSEASLVLRADQRIGRVKNENVRLIEAQKLSSCKYRQLYQEISAGKDFAYCYGEARQMHAGKEQNGFYVRVWLFQDGGWQIAADQLSLSE